MDEAQTEASLRGQTANCGRTVKASEITRAIRTAFTGSLYRATRGCGTKSTPTWPEREPERIRDLLREGFGLADLWEESPLRIEVADPEWIIDQILPGNPLLCCGASSYQFDTKTREEWRGTLGGLQFIVPSPMVAVKGITQEGKESAHTLNSTGPRMYLVCEFDEGTQDDHAGILYHLAQFAPLVMAVHSGGKSLHGWFFVKGEPEDRVAAFFRYACRLGADKATWTRSQFVRMPEGRRDNGHHQDVFYFNHRITGRIHNAS